MRTFMKHVVGRKFRRAGLDIEAWRSFDDFVIKNQRVPKGTEVEAVQLGGLSADWVRAPEAKADRAVLYLHGGGMVLCSPETHREHAANLSAATKAAFLLPDFRRAPEHPFPAALEDALMTYRWLLDQGYTPDCLAVGGDSAGGGLALQTLISLRDEGMPLPAAAFFISPVTDWVHLDGESITTRADVDICLTPESHRFMAPLYIGSNDPDTTLLSPLNCDLGGLPPLLIHVGDDEILLSDSTRLAEKAGAADVVVELEVWPGMWHDFTMSASVVPEAKRSVEEIGRFVERYLR
jgi:acetyl esterase/lipase